MINLFIIAVRAVICGTESWDGIEAFGEAKAAWLSTFLDLTNGIPAHDTLDREFAALAPSAPSNAATTR